MRIHVKCNESVPMRTYTAIQDMLPDGMLVWLSGDIAIIYDDGVEIARIDIGGLSTEEATGAVAKELKGVI